MPPLLFIAGAPGAGKTTVATNLLRSELRGFTYVNQETIAAGLSGFNPKEVHEEAEEIAYRRLSALSEGGKSIAIETTLAGAALRPLTKDVLARGYTLSLIYLWLPSVELAIARGAMRGQMNGQYQDEDYVRRCYDEGLRNLHEIYVPMSEQWGIYNTAGLHPLVLSKGRKSLAGKGQKPSLWHALQKRWKNQ